MEWVERVPFRLAMAYQRIRPLTHADPTVACGSVRSEANRWMWSGPTVKTGKTGGKI